MIKTLVFFFILFNIYAANASSNLEIANNFKKIKDLHRKPELIHMLKT